MTRIRDIMTGKNTLMQLLSGEVASSLSQLQQRPKTSYFQTPVWFAVDGTVAVATPLGGITLVKLASVTKLPETTWAVTTTGGASLFSIFCAIGS